MSFNREYIAVNPEVVVEGGKGVPLRGEKMVFTCAFRISSICSVLEERENLNHY